MSANLDCDVDAESDYQQLAVVEVERRTLAKVSLKGVLLTLGRHLRGSGSGRDKYFFFGHRREFYLLRAASLLWGVNNQQWVLDLLWSTSFLARRLRRCLFAYSLCHTNVPHKIICTS